ncbi:hypothetical protein FA15DRAFT_662128 [Coprinopsis marcescibilis]|uniref:Uncharacterized protein n=1 Tax=Coprinopsis marcescibilis TaxID=230819 RepID=A0A5C3K8U1_COPMA|nr:hypothetical protein FA15DRAFT_662128 [Coprinopsis marcescibilis]
MGLWEVLATGGNETAGGADRKEMAGTGPAVKGPEAAAGGADGNKMAGAGPAVKGAEAGGGSDTGVDLATAGKGDLAKFCRKEGNGGGCAFTNLQAESKEEPVQLARGKEGSGGEGMSAMLSEIKVYRSLVTVHAIFFGVGVNNCNGSAQWIFLTLVLVEGVRESGRADLAREGPTERGAWWGTVQNPGRADRHHRCQDQQRRGRKPASCNGGEVGTGADDFKTAFLGPDRGSQWLRSERFVVVVALHNIATLLPLPDGDILGCIFALRLGTSMLRGSVRSWDKWKLTQWATVVNGAVDAPYYDGYILNKCHYPSTNGHQGLRLRTEVVN